MHQLGRAGSRRPLGQAYMRPDAIGEPQDLGMGAAHGGGSLVSRCPAGAPTPDRAGFPPRVHEDPVGEQTVCGGQRFQRRRWGRRPADGRYRGGPRVSRSSSCSAAKWRSICSVPAGSTTSAAGLPRRAGGALQDHRDVDTLLQQGTRRRRRPSPARRWPQAHADHRALHGDMPRPARDVHCIGEPVEVGGRTRRRRPPRTRWLPERPSPPPPSPPPALARR